MSFSVRSGSGAFFGGASPRSGGGLFGAGGVRGAVAGDDLPLLAVGEVEPEDRLEAAPGALLGEELEDAPPVRRGREGDVHLELRRADEERLVDDPVDARLELERLRVRVVA